MQSDIRCRGDHVRGWMVKHPTFGSPGHLPFPSFSSPRRLPLLFPFLSVSLLFPSSSSFIPSGPQSSAVRIQLTGKLNPVPAFPASTILLSHLCSHSPSHPYSVFCRVLSTVPWFYRSLCLPILCSHSRDKIIS